MCSVGEEVFFCRVVSCIRNGTSRLRSPGLIRSRGEYTYYTPYALCCTRMPNLSYSFRIVNNKLYALTVTYVDGAASWPRSARRAARARHRPPGHRWLNLLAHPGADTWDPSTPVGSGPPSTSTHHSPTSRSKQYTLAAWSQPRKTRDMLRTTTQHHPSPLCSVRHGSLHSHFSMLSLTSASAAEAHSRENRHKTQGSRPTDEFCDCPPR